MREPGWARWRILLVVLVGLAVLSVGVVTGTRPEGGGGSAPRPEPPATSDHLDAPATDGPPTTNAARGITSTRRPPTSAAPAPDVEPRRTRDTTPMAASLPVRLQVASIGLDTTLMDLGLQVDGSLEVPPDGSSAGWYVGAPTPGEVGPAVIAGHVDWAGQPGIFFDLHELASGDDIAVTRQDGSTARFRVTRVVQTAKDAFPTAAVYGDIDHAGLRLITCGGEFDRGAGSYRDNVVVFAELVGSDTAPLTSS